MILAANREIEAQGTPVHTYYVNDGKNDVYDNFLGETSTDLLGWIPWSRYGETTPTTGHYFARAWTHPTDSFQKTMFSAALDLDELKSVIDTWCVFNPPQSPQNIIPFDSTQVFPEPGLPSFPILDFAWWHALSGPSMGTPRPVLYWPYKLNGGSVMVCVAAEQISGGSYVPAVADPAQICLFNYSTHFSHFGTNKNLWRHEQGRFRREYSEDVRFPGDIYYAESGYPGTDNAPNLGPKEQALEAGDILVFVRENFGQDFWTSLMRTQEAQWFTRHQFAPAPPALGGGSYPAIQVDRAFLHGESWGSVVSAMLALLQPKIYAGSRNWIVSDSAYGSDEYWELQNHFDTFIGRNGWSPPTGTVFTQFDTLVDLLGIRFDNPKYGRGGWDRAAFAINQRAGELKVPIYGQVGDVETVFPAHWARQDSTLGSLGTYWKATFHRNWEHPTALGWVSGVNEYSLWNGGEWQALKSDSLAVNAAMNNLIAPDTAPPLTPVFPDPYGHTLRHVHLPTANPNPAVLSELDIHAGLTPPYEKTSNTSNWVGQGLFPGFHDSMHVADIDNDGKIEVVFGNLDGYVHVLEFAGTGDSDPFRLDDEWRSPYLGMGLIGHDAYFSASFAQMFFSDSLGQIWRINAVAADTYQMQGGGPPYLPIATPNGHDLYPGATPILLVNEFDLTNGGKEILALNRLLDFSLFKVNGAPLHAASRRDRQPRILGPTDAFPIDMSDPADGSREILVTAFDGNLWQLEWDSSATAWLDAEQAMPVWTGFGLERVIAFRLMYQGLPHTIALLFGRNDDLDDEETPLNQIPVSVVQLWDLKTGELLAEATADPTTKFEEGMSFAWIAKPTTGNPTGSFVVSGGGLIEKFDLSVQLGGDSSINYIANAQVMPLPDDVVPVPDSVLALDTAVLQTQNGTEQCIVFTTANGRVYVVDVATLSYVRTSAAELGSGFSFPGPPAGWPSNRTMARTYACDLPPGTAGTGDLFFAEYASPIYHTGETPHYRIGKLSVGASSNSWTPFVEEAINDSATDTWESLLPCFNRTLLYRDLDVDGTPEARIFAEAGTAWLDPSLETAGVREFQTSSYGADFLFGGGGSGRILQGGRVFELPPGRNEGAPGYSYNEYGYLGTFHVPTYPGMHYEDYGGGANGWWYPKLGPSFLTGQIAPHEQSAGQFGFGCSMRNAWIRKAPAAERTRHVVVGTNNGFVFAIEPGDPAAGGGLVDSDLSYATRNLGSHVIGLDVGNLDDDDGFPGDAGVLEDEEIACGVWIDDGNYVDWTLGNAAGKKNRAKLFLLDPVPGTQGFTVTELDGDYLCGLREGIGSGVTGVRMDDVDGDGQKEIWCSDAIGHLYLFKKGAGGVWGCHYRSDDLAAYPGCYNNMFPIKSTIGNETVTVKLVVVSPGYVMLFAVDWTKV